MKKIIKYIKHPSKFIVWLSNKNFFWFLNDYTFLKMKYRLVIGKKLDLKNPKTFNEKLQWLKLYDRKPQYTKMVDKYEAKKYVASVIGNEYIIPTLGIYNKFDDIDFDKLPNQFVMKCTHDSGGLIIVRDKNKLDIKAARKKLEKSLKRNYYCYGREWPYKNVVPRIIIEKYMVDESKKELKDYKLFCFNGTPKITLVCSERFSSDNMCETFFDVNWKLYPFIENNHRIDTTIKKPKTFNKMLEYSRKLSKNIPFVRIDWYEIEGKLYFGEITFFPASGYEKFNPEEFGEEFGLLINLPSNSKKN